MYIKRFVLLFVLFLSSGVKAQSIFDQVRAGNVEAVKQTLKHSPDSVNAVNEAGNSVLVIASYKGQVEIVKLLLKKGADPNLSSNEGSPILAAVFKGDIAIAKLLLKKKVLVTAVGRDGNSALHYAVLNKDAEMVKLLLKYKIDPSIKNSDGQTALSLAQAEKQELLIKLLENATKQGE